MSDEVVHWFASLNEHHDAARALQFGDQFLNRVGPLDFCSLGFVAQKLIHFGSGAVVNNDCVAVVVHVQDKVLSHDGQSDEADVSLWCGVLHVFKISAECGEFVKN